MKKQEFFPTVKVTDDKMIFNSEAIETMELDTENASVVLIETIDPDKVKVKKELLIMKSNRSLCDDPENIKDTFSPDLIRKVNLEANGTGHVVITKDVSDTIKTTLSGDEFKLLVCNVESSLGKEFKEQFDITSSFYKLVKITDKRNSVGKDKNVKAVSEERVSIN